MLSDRKGLLSKAQPQQPRCSTSLLYCGLWSTIRWWWGWSNMKENPLLTCNTTDKSYTVDESHEEVRGEGQGVRGEGQGVRGKE